MYNYSREEFNATKEEVLFSLQLYFEYFQRGRGMSFRPLCRWVVLCICSLCIGLPSTLSSDAQLQDDVYYEFDRKGEHSADENGNDPADAPPQPYFQNQIEKRIEYREEVPEQQNFFDNRIPHNQIPRNTIPRGTRERNQIQSSPMPRNSIQSSPMPRKQIPRQSIERKKIERSPLPRNRIPRNSLREQIPKN